MRRIRCAIYTRKSSEEGLEQDFNSLDAQREACEAYIASQKHEGWEALPDRYDDGGISGGHLERPSLQRLMQAVDEKRVDQIVVYKIDRLTRSLADFAKLVERLDAAEASFVSVTQSFNTATSMGRLTLNVLLSFAQFEREVTAERIRDKIAASKRKGLWMGGNVPLGYQADGRTLKVDEFEAATVRTLYELYLEHGLIRVVKERAEDLGLRSRRRVRGADVSPGTLTVGLARDELARVLGCEADRLEAEDLTLTSPFRIRRRGVELKLHLGEAPPEIDRTLVRNIVKAQKWMSMIIGGKSFAEIAQAEGTSKRRVQDVVDLTLLAPDILDSIANGEQPDGLTSDTLIKSGVPATWSDQRAQFAKL
ncbi:recombinase family protein [Aestuariivita boseongensis]|uniref:recombinase family protein n=1 Tax=Aestuariivita boseongensis TaxID=1470562 RepID=UPI0009E599D9|nr:recombinase family protein [Aestuariivita boseongensis]